MIIGHILENSMNLYSGIVVLGLSVGIIYSLYATTKKFHKLRQSTNAKVLKIKKVREITPEYIPYIMACLFPVLVQFEDISRLFTVIAAIVLVMVLYAKTRMVLTNPSLIIVGFKFYEVHATDYTNPLIVISKRYPEGNFRVRDMDHDLCLEQKCQEG